MYPRCPAFPNVHVHTSTHTHKSTSSDAYPHVCTHAKITYFLEGLMEPSSHHQLWPPNAGPCVFRALPQRAAAEVSGDSESGLLHTHFTLEEVGAQWKKGPGEDVNPGLRHSPSQPLPMLTQPTPQQHGDRSPPGCLPLQRKGLKHPESWQVGLWSPLE